MKLCHLFWTHPSPKRGLQYLRGLPYLNKGLLDISASSELRVRLAQLSPPVKYLTDRSKAVLHLWIFYVFFFCIAFAMPLCASVYLCLVVTCWERADLLTLVCCANCEFVTFPLVSWAIASILDLCTLTNFGYQSWFVCAAWQL